MATSFNLFDRVFLKSYLIYKSFFLNVKTMPLNFIREVTQGLNSDYKNKFPNTGILSVMYATKFLNVKNIYILGLDFYVADYIYRTKHANPLEIQHKKFKDLDLVNILLNFIENNKNINFYIRSKYQINNKPSNLIIL